MNYTNFIIFLLYKTGGLWVSIINKLFDLVKKLDVVDSSSTIDDTNSETISDEFSLEYNILEAVLH